ncbi:MAG: hypothetical protein AAFV07_20090 [Bacteroidota bacterium]
MTLIDWLGFIGVFQILLAYLLQIFRIISQDDWSFLWLNLVGAGMACLSAILMLYWPFIIMEGVWTVATLITMIKKVNGGRNKLADPDSPHAGGVE